ncbi:MAG: hypothetical protein R6V14_01440 [Halanaerobiales bacterium]
MPFVNIKLTCPHCGEVVNYNNQPSNGIFRKRCNNCMKNIVLRTKDGKVIKVKKE